MLRPVLGIRSRFYTHRWLSHLWFQVTAFLGISVYRELQTFGGIKKHPRSEGGVEEGCCGKQVRNHKHLCS